MDLSRNNNDDNDNNDNDTMNTTPPPWFSSADVATLHTAVALAVVRQRRRRRGLPQQPSSDTVIAPEDPIVLSPSSHQQQQVVVQQHLDAMMATAVRLVQSKKPHNHPHPHHTPVLPTGLVAHLRHIWRHASVVETTHLWWEHPWPALSHVWQEIIVLPHDHDNAALPNHVVAQLRTDLGQLITTQALWQVWRDTTTTTSSNSSTTSHNTSATLDDLLPLVELLHQCGGGMPDAHGVYPADLYTLYHHQAPPATTPTAMVDALWLRYAVGRS